MSSVRNGAVDQAMHDCLQSVEAGVRARYAGQSRRDLENLPAVRPYVDYYRRFGKTYHVLLQLESVAFRGRPVAASQPLVSAMFAAEVGTHLLTAGHDLAALVPPLLADVTRADERYVGISGKPIDVKPGDLSIRDSQGIVSTILYGPDQRTRLLPETESVLFTTYAPPGVADSILVQHLRGIQKLVLCGSPTARTEVLECRSV